MTPALCMGSTFCGRVASSATVCTNATRSFWYFSKTCRTARVAAIVPGFKRRFLSAGRGVGWWARASTPRVGIVFAERARAGGSRNVWNEGARRAGGDGFGMGHGVLDCLSIRNEYEVPYVVRKPSPSLGLPTSDDANGEEERRARRASHPPPPPPPPPPRDDGIEMG
jgi:hypothetical protein